MKKLLILTLLVSLFTSCVDYTTYHHFYMDNISSDTLEFRYKTVRMERLIDTIVKPDIQNFSLNGDYEHGKEDRMSNEGILEHFEFLEFVNGTDTLRLNDTTITKWLRYYDTGNVDFGEIVHTYTIEITEEDLE